MASSQRSQILAALASVFGDSASHLGSAEHENEVKHAFVARPKNVEQVQGLVRALRPLVLSGDCKLAIRNSGNRGDYFPGSASANVQEEVTIDTRRIKGIKLSDDQSAVEIGAGERWSPVYAKLREYGLVVAGSPDGDAGVAGFLLSGGLSILSGKTGFACDSVVEFQVVLASGEVVRANAEEHADLWRSLKGGLNNFGIVTSFKMKVFKSRRIWGGTAYYSPEAFMELVHWACVFAEDDSDEHANISCCIDYRFGEKEAWCEMYHTRGRAYPPSLMPFMETQPQIEEDCTVQISTQLKLSNDWSNAIKFESTNPRHLSASITIKGCMVSVLEDVYEEWENTLEELKHIIGFSFTLGFMPLTKSMLKNSAEAGGNAMAIPPSDGPLFLAVVDTVWPKPKYDNLVFEEIENLMAACRRLVGGKGHLHRFIHASYAHHEDDVIAGYGRESVSRLRETSKRYDPEGVFQKGTPGGFKLLHHYPVLP
ncbi:hypothetical protein K445DRAFT_18613 [Daldinia sp. EC12]|nr:hypothetical protein K445DRAFT_18613 [Daldinia sp. EC12]